MGPKMVPHLEQRWPRDPAVSPKLYESQPDMTRDIWSNLPADIIHLIVGFLLSSKVDLRHLSLVNHSFRAIAQHYLHRDVFLVVSPEALSKFFKFVRTVISRPNLANSVRTLHLFCHRERSVTAAYAPHDDVINCARQVGVPFIEEWIHGLSNGSVDALIALLLSHLSNLTRLQLITGYSAPIHLMGSLLRSAVLRQNLRTDSRLPSYSSLTDVEFELESQWQPDQHELRSKRSQYLLSMFYLPNLQALSLRFDMPTALEWPMQPPPISASLTSLTLGQIRENLLEEILMLTPQLRKLLWYANFGTAGRDEIDLAALAKAFSHVSHTLADLKLIACADDDTDLAGSLRELKDFPILTKLHAPLEYLTSSFEPDTALPLSAVLPINLESPILTDNFDRTWQTDYWPDTQIQRRIVQFLEDSWEPQRLLRELTVMVQDKLEREWHTEAGEVLIKLCEPYGIRTKVDEDGR